MALANHGLLAEPVVLDRLSLHPGDTARLGNASFTVRGALIAEPDRVAAPLMLGPRVLIAAAALPATGLIAPGSMVHYAHPRHAAGSGHRTLLGLPLCARRSPARAGASATRARPRPAWRGSSTRPACS